MPFEFDPKYDRYLIREFPLWRLYLHQNQCYPGRMYVAAYRDFIQKTQMTLEEREELFMIECLTERAISHLTMASHFNYFWGANEWHHAHSHIIPRYRQPFTLMGHTFTDKSWGHNYAPYQNPYPLDPEIFQMILHNLRRNLQPNY